MNMDELLGATSTEELTDEVIFEGWDDDSVAKEETEEETEEEVETESEEADQPETEEAEDASDDEDTEEAEAEEDDEEKEADQLFTLKHLDEVKEVTRDEVITLAQKGLDYDRIRAERDTLKSEKAQYQEHEDFLNYLAEVSGTSIEEVMINTKAKLVQQEEKKKGYDITLDQARYRVRSEMKSRKKEEEPPPVEEPPEPPKVNKAELREANFKRFVEAYPDVKSEDIPKEVWKEFGDGTSKELTELYARYENKQLKAKIADLEKKQKKSTGSRRSNGSPAVDEGIYAGW